MRMRKAPKVTQKRTSDPIIGHFTVGPMAVNAYCLADPVTKEACLIDPGFEPKKMKAFLEKNGLSLKFIINTHGHGDHIGANADFAVPIYIHTLDKDFLTDPRKNQSKFFIFSISSPEASRLLNDKDKIKLGSLELEVIHTPGHTPGSISIKVNGVIFTGDTLFAGGVGRTDLYGGDEELLFKSINERLFVFPDDTVIYPGHGGSSTIGEERRWTNS